MVWKLCAPQSLIFTKTTSEDMKKITQKNCENKKHASKNILSQTTSTNDQSQKNTDHIAFSVILGSGAEPFL